MEIIPLRAVPNQAVTVQLNGQNCQINVYQKPTALFIDLLKDNSPVVMGCICQDRNAVVRDAYFGFVGDISWLDQEGNLDPFYSGIGTRFFLAYLPPE